MSWALQISLLRAQGPSWPQGFPVDPGGAPPWTAPSLTPPTLSFSPAPSLAPPTLSFKPAPFLTPPTLSFSPAPSLTLPHHQLQIRPCHDPTHPVSGPPLP